MPRGRLVAQIPEAAEITGWLTPLADRRRAGARPAVRGRAPAAAPAGRAPAAAGAPRPHARTQRRRQRALPAPDRQPADLLPGSRPLLRHRGADDAAHPHRSRARARRRQARRRAAARAALGRRGLERGDRPAKQLLDLDAQLSALAAADPRAARVVELRFFGGLREEDVAEVLQVSAITVKRDWKAARAWLAARLQ